MALTKAKLAAALKAVDALNPDLNLPTDATLVVYADNGTSVVWHAKVEDIVQAVADSLK